MCDRLDNLNENGSLAARLPSDLKTYAVKNSISLEIYQNVYWRG